MRARRARRARWERPLVMGGIPPRCSHVFRYV